MLNEMTLKSERELILADPIVSAVLEIEAESIGVTVEDYCDRFLESFYENPSAFTDILCASNA
jgi:hypothetical protein